MKVAVFIVCLVASVYSFAVPIRPVKRLNAVKEAPGVISYSYDLFVTDISIGTPPQTFTVAIDTWGYNIWVPDALCINDYIVLWEEMGPCYDKRMFYANESTSYSPVFGIFDGTDHLGAVSGKIGMDRITLGQIANQTTVIKPDFGQAIHIDNAIQNMTLIDGIIGFAGSYNWIDQAYLQGDFSVNVVTLSMENQYETSDNGTHGVIYYGNYDLLHCNRTFEVENTATTAYQFTVTQFNGAGAISNTFRQAILDSTSPFIKVPRTIASQVLSFLGMNTNTTLPATVDCSMANSTLSFTFKTSKGVERISAVNLVLYDEYSRTCQLAMTVAQPFPTDSSAGHFELGIPFFRGRWEKFKGFLFISSFRCIYLDRSQSSIGFGVPGKRVKEGK